MIRMIKSQPSICLLVTTYNWPAALDLLLQSVRQQSILPQEIIIADDGSASATRKIIEKHIRLSSIHIYHIWQEDRGFRKTLIINKALRHTSCDYIIQIDGDIVLQKHFIADHLAFAEPGCFVQGSRVLLGANRTRRFLHSGQRAIYPFTTGIGNRLNALRLRLLANLFKGKPYDYNKIRACNLAFWRKDFLRINGYDNRFNGWGWEDVEFAARLVHSGIRKKKLKFAGLCYHLHHPLSTRRQAAHNELLFTETVRESRRISRNGYVQIETVSQ
jgi:glycosyltransferase involved in cell wall biosynthesis